MFFLGIQIITTTPIPFSWPSYLVEQTSPFFPESDEENVKTLRPSDSDLSLRPNTLEEGWLITKGFAFIDNTQTLYVYLEPKWPLFWLEKVFFWRVDLQE